MTMHPRDRLQLIIDETRQLIIDTESWNDNNPNEQPIDCEGSRVTLATAKKAASLWDAGRTDEAIDIMKLMSESE